MSSDFSCLSVSCKSAIGICPFGFRSQCVAIASHVPRRPIGIGQQAVCLIVADELPLDGVELKLPAHEVSDVGDDRERDDGGAGADGHDRLLARLDACEPVLAVTGTLFQMNPVR